jgi:hypothetical protein
MTLSRRAVLRGAAGVALGLPTLASLLPRSTWSEELTAPRRLVIVYLPNGALPQHFAPTGVGPDWVASRYLSGLERHRSRLTVLTGMRTLLPDERGSVEDQHGLPVASVLTGEDPYGAAALGPQGGASVDHLIASALAGQTPIPSIELISEGQNFCPAGVPCRWNGYVSFESFGRPKPRLFSLASAFERVTGAPLGLSPADAAARTVRRAAVLDHVHAASRSLAAKMSGEDRVRMDAWLTSVDEVAQRTARGVAACPPPPDLQLPTGVVGAEAHTAAMIDLVGLALACDRTRVVSYMLGLEGGRRVFPELGIWDEHHYLSHHGGQPDFQERYSQIVDWEFREVARLLDHLEATPAEDGAPLLDHTLVAVVGSIGEPDVHDPLNVPVVLAGAKGWLPHGEHIALDGEPTTNLCSSLLTWMGLPGDPFGLNGTGPVAALARGRP